MTRAIAAKDLKVLWASAIPYVVGALFHLVLAGLYVDQLDVRKQAVMQPMFPIAGFLLIVTTPVLAMRTFAEEARSGTLDLLQAVPIRSGPLVVGKWIAAWVTVLAVLAPSLVFVVLVQWFGNPDAGPVVAGFLGLALLAASLAAIGVAASSFSSSQPVAAMVALFVSLLFWFAHAGSDRGTSGAFLSLVSLSERLRAFASGVIDTSDVAFFTVAAAGALVVAGLAVDGRRLR